MGMESGNGSQSEDPMQKMFSQMFKDFEKEGAEGEKGGVGEDDAGEFMKMLNQITKGMGGEEGDG